MCKNGVSLPGAPSGGAGIASRPNASRSDPTGHVSDPNGSVSGAMMSVSDPHPTCSDAIMSSSDPAPDLLRDDREPYSVEHELRRLVGNLAGGTGAAPTCPRAPPNDPSSAPHPSVSFRCHRCHPPRTL